MDRREFLQRSAAAASLLVPAALVPLGACGPSLPTDALGAAALHVGDGAPLAFASDGSRGLLDPNTHRVSRFASDGRELFSVATLGTGRGEFNAPVAAVFDEAGLMYVLDRGNHRVQVLDTQGEVVAIYGGYGSEPHQLASPSALVIDAQGRLLIADTHNHRVVVWSTGANGAPLLQFGVFGAAGAVDSATEQGLNAPRGLASWADGEVWVLDSGNRRVQRYSAEGAWLGGFSLPDTIAPRAMARSRDDLVYIADLASAGLSVFDRSGAAQTARDVQVDGRNAQVLFLVTDPAGDVHAAAIAARPA